MYKNEYKKVELPANKHQIKIQEIIDKTGDESSVIKEHSVGDVSKDLSKSDLQILNSDGEDDLSNFYDFKLVRNEEDKK